MRQGASERQGSEGKEPITGANPAARSYLVEQGFSSWEDLSCTMHVVLMCAHVYMCV